KKRRSERVNLNKCINELRALLLPITDDLKVALECRLTDQYTDISGSEALVDGIMLNLIMNSLNAFQRPNAPHRDRRIRIESFFEADAVMLIVEDNAGGVEGIELSDMWLPGVTTSPEGTGFGLTIVRDSVADLGGTVDAIARTDFGGAKFI